MTDATAEVSPPRPRTIDDMSLRTCHATILDHFGEDERIDFRYRKNTLANMRTQLAARRSGWGSMKALMGLGRSKPVA